MSKLISLLVAQVQVEPGDFPTIPKGNGVTADTVAHVMQIILGVAGGAALLIITIAGLQYVLSRGNPQETARAKNTILYALVGLLVSMGAFMIVTFVVGRL